MTGQPEKKEPNPRGNEEDHQTRKDVFNNKYEAAGSLALTAEKKLEGKQLEEGKYSFVLKDSKGTELQTKQNGADGSVSFDAIEYTLADAGKDFTYTVAEVAGNEAGVTYDSSVYTVKVHVADKGTGTLEVTKKITRRKDSRSSRKPGAEEKKPAGRKIQLCTKDSKEPELRRNRTVQPEACHSNNKCRKDFTYTVAEVAGNEAGVTYDQCVWPLQRHAREPKPRGNEEDHQDSRRKDRRSRKRSYLIINMRRMEV